MILLESNYQLLISGISITEWIQSIAALVAIVGGIVGFVTFWRKDKDKEKKINSLISIAEQSENQTRELSNQVEQMIKSNQLQIRYLELLEKNVEIAKYNQTQQEEKLEIDKERRKVNIKPKFRYDFSLKSQHEVKYVLINDGGSANFI